MQMYDVNPYIRFASEVHYKSKHKTVFVRDCRMFYVLSGTGEIIIGNKHYNFAPNSFFYCCGSSVYSIESTEGMTLIVLNFDFDQSRSWKTISFPLAPILDKESVKHDTSDCISSDVLGEHFFLSDAKGLHARMSELVNEFAAQKLYYREKCSALLKDFIIMLQRGELHKSESSGETVRFVIEYIHGNFRRKIENGELAKLAGYHEYHLNRLFIKYTGMSLHRYILNQRMTEAKKLLINTSMPLAAIAESVGFGNNTYFSCYFKKEFSMSPSDYRKKFKNTI